jgi:hypothetical protein
MRVTIAIACVLGSTTAAAEPAATAHRQLVYGEALGKAGAYGLGWELALTRRLSIGAAASFAIVRDQQLYTLAPYLHATFAGEHRHALFGELGLAIAHSRLPSPVPEWDGMSDTGAGAQAALGYEYRRGRLVGRFALGAAAGAGGVAPFGGLALGVRL